MLVVVEVAAVIVAVVGRRSGTVSPLQVRVAQAGVIAGSDVVHDALESPASPPEPTSDLVEVRRRRAILLVPGERPLTPIDEEGVPSRAVVGIPARIPTLLRCKLEVVVVRDGRPARHTLRDRRDRHASGAQVPASGDGVAGRAGVVRGAKLLSLQVG